LISPCAQKPTRVTALCRFAPSATGRAHPGTLLAGLLAWLDARQRHARLVLRLEDLDPQRCTPELVQCLHEDLRWFGLDFDLVEIQSQHHDRHAAALDHLSARGALYPCSFSRSALQALGRRGPDGAWQWRSLNTSPPIGVFPFA
jgi:glutamyl-Q tRNA(Asp) synthetase